MSCGGYLLQAYDFASSPLGAPGPDDDSEWPQGIEFRNKGKKIGVIMDRCKSITIQYINIDPGRQGSEDEFRISGSM